MKTLEEIRNSGYYYKHHTESRRGFISRRKGGEKVTPKEANKIERYFTMKWELDYTR